MFDPGDFRNIGIPDNEVESTIFKTIKYLIKVVERRNVKGRHTFLKKC